MDLVVVALTFAAVFLVELPDKTFLATLVLSTKYPSRWVWIGVGLAFLVQTVLAVAFGQAVSLLPVDLVRFVAAAMFLIGAIILFRTAREHGSEELARQQGATATAAQPGIEPSSADLPPHRVIGTSFVVLFAAEWGDLSQVLTLTLAAKYDEPISVFAGAWLALLGVSALAIIVGRELLRRVRLSLLHYLGGSICLLLAVITAYEMAS
jgi:Ca2+/H+ antiporter, TMEM165/GDT1 family